VAGLCTKVGTCGPLYVFFLHLLRTCTHFWERTKLHITLNAMPSCLHQPNSIYLHQCTKFYPITITFTFHVYKPSESTCPNHLKLLFLIIKLTGYNPNNYLTSVHFSFFQFQSKPVTVESCPPSDLTHQVETTQSRLQWPL